MSRDDGSVDPGTVEILRNRIRSVAEEMQVAVMNAAYSPIWQESGDLSCAVLDPSAGIIGQSERVIPVHIATMTNSVSVAIERTGGYEGLAEGDVLIQNDPYSGNNHLPDFVMAQPVFVDDALMGFSSVRGHWVDVGGTSPTSYSTQTGELIQEGLRVPPAKLYEAGERNDALFEVILANVRDRQERLGDMNAQLAGVRRGRERFAELCERRGVETVEGTVETVLRNDERRMRNRIEEVPDGSYSAVDHIDGDGIDDTPIEIRTTVTVDGDEIAIDFAGTDDQAEGGVNAPISCTETASYYAIKVTLDPGPFATSGAYEPISVTAPEGSVVNPRYPAPVVAGNHETTNRIYDVVVKAIAGIDPELAFGAGDGSANVFSYRSLRTKQINLAAYGGGMGACPTRDGINAIRSGIGNSGLQPIERVEDEYDFVTVEEFSIATDSGGAGRNRGGNAQHRVIRFDDDTGITVVADRAKTQPFGVDGGRPGQSARHVHIDPDGDRHVLSSKATTEIGAGSRVRFQPAGGGGYGDPRARSVDRVLSDLRDGYVSHEAARDEYGVVVDPETDELDDAATRSLRDE